MNTTDENGKVKSMTAQGLLLNQSGQDFLLTTESRQGLKTHRLIVLQRIDGEWQQLTGIQEEACRESCRYTGLVSTQTLEPPMIGMAYSNGW
jgi:hypothetical protein